MAKFPAGREGLRALLRDYNEHPDRREHIVDEINQRYSQSVGILVLDSSGFSRTTRTSGIIHFLAMLERMERTVRPIIEQQGGRVLRTEADNIFAVFPDALTAVRCAWAILQALDALNEYLPAAEEIYVSMGVGYGPVLVVGDHDLYGDEMNIACKLGEDLAQRGEILLTASAQSCLDSSQFELEPVSFAISGLSLDAFRLQRVVAGSS